VHRTMKALSAVSIAAAAALCLGTGSSIAATQAADNNGGSKASNEAATQQRAAQEQGARSSSGNRDCGKFCAGGGGNLTPQDQNLNQKAHTGQDAFSAAIAKQHNLNVNAPVSVEGNNKKSKKGHDGSDGWWNPFGGGSANQVAFNGANSRASNSAWTGQGASQSQWASSSSGNSGCWAFCTGGGGNLTPQSQNLGQHASTDQLAASLGVAKQKNLNANTPASIGGTNGLKGHSGSSADQLAENDARSKATNQAATKQGADQSQKATSSSGNDGCSKFCTGGGGNLTPQDQNLNQKANTDQSAASLGAADQQLLNVNVPITIVGWGSVGTAGGSANQLASNDAASKASNQAATQQGADQSQKASSSSGNSGCTAYCTGGGGNLTPQDQNLNQSANTSQQAASAALANQKIMNVNIPITIVGWGSVGTAGGSANQLATNSASSAASNQAATQQHASQAQQANSSSGNSGCTAYCTGGGGNLTPQSQNLGQHAGTSQGALSVGAANQGASNTNSPVAVG
jgi:hypothetical protein